MFILIDGVANGAGASAHSHVLHVELELLSHARDPVSRPILLRQVSYYPCPPPNISFFLDGYRYYIEYSNTLSLLVICQGFAVYLYDRLSDLCGSQ